MLRCVLSIDVGTQALIDTDRVGVDKPDVELRTESAPQSRFRDNIAPDERGTERHPGRNMLSERDRKLRSRDGATPQQNLSHGRPLLMAVEDAGEPPPREETATEEDVSQGEVVRQLLLGPQSVLQLVKRDDAFSEKKLAELRRGRTPGEMGLDGRWVGERRGE